MSEASEAARHGRTAGGGRTLGRFEPGPSPARRRYHEVQSAFGTQDRIALAITGAIGTMYAVYALIVVMAGWILVQQVLGPGAFDPYPFAFLLFLGNIVQLLLMPLLMVGQNLQSRHAEARSENEYATVGKIFHDIEQTMRHLDAQDGELLTQTQLLVGLVEALVPADQRARILAAVPPAGTPSGAPAVPKLGAQAR